MKPIKPTYKAILTILFSLLLTACSGAGGKAPANQRLTVGIMPDLDSIPFVVAQEQGYLPEYVTLEIFKSPVDRDSALMSGGLDGVISDVLAVALAQNGEFDAYATSKTDGRYAVLAGKDSGVTSAAQLEGKQIGLSVNTIIEYVTDRIVAASGGNPSAVSKVAVPKIPARLELLESGQLDAIAVPEPYVTAAAANGAVILSTSSEQNVNPAVMLFTGDAIRNKARELKALYAAYDKAAEYINTTDKSAFMPGVIDILGLPESAVDVELPAYTAAALPEKAEIDLAVEWLMEKGLLDKELTYGDLVREIAE